MYKKMVYGDKDGFQRYVGVDIENGRQRRGVYSKCASALRKLADMTGC